MNGPNRLRMEPLADRLAPSAVTAAFADGVLTVTGTDAADQIAVTAAGTADDLTPRAVVSVGGAPGESPIPVAGGAPAAAAVTKVVVNAGGGDDVVFAQLSATAEAVLDGGAGNDLLTAGLEGGPTALIGGDGDDTATVSRAGVTVDLGGGRNTLNDFRMTAPTGMAVIPVDADTGPMTAAADGPFRPATPVAKAAVTAAFADGVLTVTGTDAADAIFVTPAGSPDAPQVKVTVHGDGHGPYGTEVAVTGGAPAVAAVKKVVVNAGGGDDFVAADGLTTVTAELNGQAGNDTLAGGLTGGPTTLDGGDGDDTLTVSRDGVSVVGGAGKNTLFDTRLSAVGEPSAVTAAFADGVLTVTGTDASDTIFVTGRAGFDGDDTPRLAVHINGAGGDPSATEVPIAGGNPAVADVKQVVVNAGGGDDFATVDVYGLTAEARINGQAGNDTLPSGLNGGPVTLDGGDGDDTLTVSRDGVSVVGGAGKNTLFDTRLSAVAEPAAVTAAFADGVLTVTGTDAADQIAVTAAGTADDLTPRAVVSVGGAPGESPIPIAGGAPAAAAVKKVVVNAGGGDDVVFAQLSAAAELAVDGGAGNDLLTAGLEGGPTALTGGDGDDEFTVSRNGVTVDGGAGRNTLNDFRMTRPGGPGVVEFGGDAGPLAAAVDGVYLPARR